LIAEKYEQMTGILKQIYQYQLSNRQIEQQFEQHLTKLSEDIHWLLLINGFVLFEISESEENKIPEKIMNYDASITTDVNNLTNLSNLLDQPTLVHNQVACPILNSINLSLIDAKVPDTFNPVISFAFTGMQLAELENHMFCLNMLQYLSPQVATTLVWFFKELCQSFLFMNESNYSFINPALHHFFGPDTQSASTILKFLIRKILINFYIWSSETTCTVQTAKLLIELSKNRSVAKHLMHDANYWSIGHVVIHSDQQPWKLLPTSVKKLAIKSLIISCLGQPNENIVNSVQALGSRFEALNSESSNFHSESKIKEVMSLIESLNGIIEATSHENLNFLIGLILPRLEQGVHLLDRYHNYGEIVELVLDMYNGVIEKILTQLNVSLIEHVSIKNKILECFLGLIQIFAKHNQRRQSIDVNIEEDYFNDLLLFLTLLNRLHNINYDNDENRFLPIEPSTNEQNSVIKVIDVILIGLEFLIPLMSKEILKFQTLAIEYFRLTSNISFNNSDKIFSRPIQLYNSLISSIQFGLTS
ncbi:exportin-4, partial [Brachionus plicatilis]